MNRFALASLVALALPPAARAAVPVPVSPRTIEARPVSLAFDQAGQGLAAWQGLRGSGPDRARPFHALASRTFGGEWQPPVYLPRSVITYAVSVLGQDHFALVTEREQPAGRAHTRSVVTASVGTILPLAPGRSQVLARGPRTHIAYDGPRPTLYTPVAGGTPAGTVVVAWQRAAPRSRSGVWAQTLGGPARRLGPYGTSPALTLAPDGSGLLTWRRGSLILARVRFSTGRWGPVETISRIGRYTELAAPSLTGAGGEFAVALTTIRRTGTSVSWRPSIHIRLAGGAWKGVLFAPYTIRPTGTTAFVGDNARMLAVTRGDGELWLAWPSDFGGRRVISVADAGANALDGATVGHQRIVASGAGVVDDVAAGAGDAWAMSWFDLSRPDGTPNLFEGGPTFQATTGLATERAAAGSRLAYDPLTGHPVVIWSQGSAKAGYQIVAAS